MSVTQSYWSVPQRAGEPAYWVCMSCLSEAFYLKVPMPDCPTCHGVSTYEAFTLEAIRDWGTEDLIAKAGIAQQAASLEPVPAVTSVPTLIEEIQLVSENLDAVAGVYVGK